MSAGRREFLRRLTLAVVPAAHRLTAQAPESNQIEDLVAAGRILASHDIFDAYGHVSLRSERNPQRYFMSRSVAPELVSAGDILEYDLDSNAIGSKSPPLFLERFIHGEI